jgi:hypothetical protein
MSALNSRTVLVCGLIVALCASAPHRLSAQAPPGPMVPGGSTNSRPAPYEPEPEPESVPQLHTAQPSADRPAPAPRQNIAGAWNFDQNASDDARQKIKEAERSGGTRNGPNSGGNGGGNGPWGGSGPVGGGYPYPYPGGPMGGGGPYGGPQNGPQGPAGGERDDETQSPAIREYIYPPSGLTFVLKDSEADLIDDQGRRREFFTDGRKLQKSKDDNDRQIAAHWEGTRLVADERSPSGERLRRSFQLSTDGRQLDEEVFLGATRSRAAVTLHYAYDINPNRL